MPGKRKKRSSHRRIVSTSVSQRKKIWEVNPNLHCSIIGTCLSLTDLRAIARRAGVHFPRQTTEHEIHATFAKEVESPSRISKLVDRTLEKKHRRALALFRSAQSITELERLWQEASERGDIAGGYWAAMSHPLLSGELKATIYGEVHMLSHVLGASRRLDLRKLQKMEAHCATLEDKLSQTKIVYRKRLKNRDQVVSEMSGRLLSLASVERKLSLATDKLLEVKRNSGVDILENRVRQLESALARERAAKELAEAELDRNATLLEEERRLRSVADAQNELLAEENGLLEQELLSALACQRDGSDCSSAVPTQGEDLCGRKIMYVGGRSHLVRHYRALVERRGGEFLHHDGGIEQSIEMLKRSMTSVDAVICPIDCVSHGACQSVKQTCKHLAKQFIPVRSSGLSSFARGIEAIA